MTGKEFYTVQIGGTEERGAEKDGKKWRLCIYIRLSREEIRREDPKMPGESRGKSESIKNQKSILLTWIEEYFPAGTYEIAGFFEDDGLTGTDDRREAFQRMLGVLERGKGNCVIVKTLSRAFRNYSDQGYYLEEYFPARDIRFISTMDPFVDTQQDGEAMYNLDVPLYGILNDRFAAATSRAVRRTLDDKRRKGKYIGAFPPWGFLKDPRDKNHLILDPETAPIKRQVKDWILYEGMSLEGAAKRLNDLGIPNPTKYKELKGWKYKNPHAFSQGGKWTGTTLKRELLSLMNMGHMVQGKQRVISYKIHERAGVPEEDWKIVENTHEATFTREEFQALREALSRNTRVPDGKRRVHLFSGYIRCACCQRAMHRSHGKTWIYYKCRSGSGKAGEECRGSIREDRLAAAVLKAIEMQIWLAGDAGWILEKKYYKRDESFHKLLAAREQQRKRTEDLYDGLYRDWRMGELSETEYRRLREQWGRELRELEGAVLRLKKEEETLSGALPEQLSRENFRNGTSGLLSRSVLGAFLNTIAVGQNRKEITIVFRFQDKLLHEAVLSSKEAEN